MPQVDINLVPSLQTLLFGEVGWDRKPFTGIFSLWPELGRAPTSHWKVDKSLVEVREKVVSNAFED